MILTLDQALRRYPLPRLESRMLLQHILPHATHAHIIAHPDECMSTEHAHAFIQLVQRRLQGEPIAYILQKREFYGRSFCITPDALIPRPETEGLVEVALNQLNTLPSTCSILDLGTGSGIIAITLALEAKQPVQVTAADISLAALKLAQKNAAHLGASIHWVHSNWFEALPPGSLFHLIVSNPPYIAQTDPHLAQGDLRFEPRQALTDHSDGLDCLRTLINHSTRYLHPFGWLMVEHGYDQGAAVAQLFAENTYQHIQTLPDLAGLDRLTIGQYHPHP